MLTRLPLLGHPAADSLRFASDTLVALHAKPMEDQEIFKAEVQALAMCFLENDTNVLVVIVEGGTAVFHYLISCLWIGWSVYFVK